MLAKLKSYLYQPVNAAPIAVFRILFGLLMLASIIRFWANGWIASLYIQPQFHFTYYGFEWVKPLGNATYVLFLICAITTILIILGYKYRIAIILFFLSFTYIELMDKTTYLNHYYFISILSFLMIFLPADRYFSLRTYFNPATLHRKIPRWTIFSIQLLLAVVYFYAGLAKLNSDWLLKAMPLKIWLPSNQGLPILGNFLTQDWFIYIMAWTGAMYDLIIPFLLWNRKTRWLAFSFVVIFHVMTRILFPIGMFPFVMILSTLIFFSASFHEKIIHVISRILPIPKKYSFTDIVQENSKILVWSSPKWVHYVLITFFVFQLLIPFRHLLYPGELFWTEQGYRFSWRVMLMEKAGYTAFIVQDAKTGKRVRVEASEYLTPFQEKQMSFQPDFILEFAHFLAEEYKKKGFRDPQVFADSYVALNGRNSKRYIKPHVDLAKEKRGLHNYNWILPFEDKIYGL